MKTRRIWFAYEVATASLAFTTSIIAVMQVLKFSGRRAPFGQRWRPVFFLRVKSANATLQTGVYDKLRQTTPKRKCSDRQLFIPATATSCTRSRITLRVICECLCSRIYNPRVQSGVFGADRIRKVSCATQAICAAENRLNTTAINTETRAPQCHSGHQIWFFWCPQLLHAQASKFLCIRTWNFTQNIIEKSSWYEKKEATLSPHSPQLSNVTVCILHIPEMAVLFCNRTILHSYQKTTQILRTTTIRASSTHLSMRRREAWEFISLSINFSIVFLLITHAVCSVNLSRSVVIPCIDSVTVPRQFF